MNDWDCSYTCCWGRCLMVLGCVFFAAPPVNSHAISCRSFPSAVHRATLSHWRSACDAAGFGIFRHVILSSAQNTDQPGGIIWFSKWVCARHKAATARKARRIAWPHPSSSSSISIWKSSVMSRLHLTFLSDTICYFFFILLCTFIWVLFGCKYHYCFFLSFIKGLPCN